MSTKLVAAFLLGAACLGNLRAENRVYLYTTDDGESPLLGFLNRFSDNGRWAVGGDEPDDSGSFIIDTSDPENIVRIAGGLLFDISDDGVAVGSWYDNQGSVASPVNYDRAGYFKDGEWHLLERPEGCTTQYMATSITPDGKRIGGHGYCIDLQLETGNKSYPIFWDLDEATGEYKGRVYNHLQLPNHQGFFSRHMTPDGRILCGKVYAGAGSELPAMLKDDEFVIWSTVEERWEDFYYKDELLGTFLEYYIDGMHDGWAGDYHSGAFIYANDKYLFGYRTVITNPNYEAGSGTYNYYSTVYDIEADEFIDSDFGFFTCGIDPQTTFGTSAYIDGKRRSLSSFFNFKSDQAVAGIYDISSDGKMLAGTAPFFNEAIMSYVDSPALIILDESPIAPAGIQAPLATPAKAWNVAVDGRCIVVDGAAKVAVYSVDGTQVAASARSAELRPGVYVVVADGQAVKVAVK